MKKFLATCLCVLMLISCTANIEYIVLLNDGVNNKEIRCNNISTIIIPEVEREGYDLVGIHDANGKNYESGDIVLINNNMTFTWEWTKLNKVTLTCNGQKETQWLKPDTRFEIPKKSKDGYILSSITDADGNTYKIGEIIIPTKDIELTYNWNQLINKYTVTIISDGKFYSSESIDKGKTYTIPSINNENFRLISILDGSGFKYTPGSDLIINDNLTLIYNWDKISTKYTVSLINGETIENVEVAENEVFTIPEKINAGHIINTITDNFGNIYKTGQSIKIKNNLSLTYSWTKLIDEYTITIISDGNVLSNQIVKKGTPYKIPTPTKEGHTLVSIIDETGTKLIPGSKIEVRDNLVLVYNWQLKDCTITIISNNLKQEYTVSYGNPFTLPEKYLSGNSLVSITDLNNNSYTAGNTITVRDDMTITYNWAPVKQHYTVSIINDGTLTDTTINRGESFILEEKAKPGYRLKSISDNYGKTYNPGESVVIIGDLAFTYNWQKVWNVTEIHNGEVLTTEVDDNSFYNTKLEKDGYELRSINGSNGVDYTHENIIQINSNLTLTYDWAKLYTVTIQGYATPSQIMIADGKSLELNKSNPGYRLECITGSDGINYTDASTIIVNRDLTLTYNWIKQYQVNYEGTTLPVKHVDKETTITIPDFENRGYYLDSITDENGKVLSAGTPIKITSDTTITWNWLKENPATDFKYSHVGNEITIEQLLYSDTPNVIIPAYIDGKPVTALAENAFSDKSCTSIYMPDSIRNIISFDHNYDLISIRLSNSIYEIPDNTFHYCGNLKSIRLPNSLRTIGNYAFKNCEKLEEIIFPDTLESIGFETFSGCKNFRKLVLPKSIQTLGAYAFANCSSLTDITISNNIPTVYNNVFEGCPGAWSIPDTVFINWTETDEGLVITGYEGSLKNLVIPEYIANKKVIGLNKNIFWHDIKSIRLPNTIEFIESSNFSGNYNIDWIFIPKSIKRIAKEAFKDYHGIIVIEAGADSTGWDSSWKDTSYANVYTDYVIGDIYFSEPINENETSLVRYIGDDSVTKITIPEKISGKIVRKIESPLFSSCNNLEEVTIPDSVKIIGCSAFSQNLNLKTVNMSHELTTIENSAFYHCTSLTSIILPDTIESLGNNAFDNCTKLSSINIPKNLKSIGMHCFNNCSSLQKIILNNGLQTIGSQAFYDCSKLRILYIPNSVTSVESKICGKDFNTKIYIQNGTDKTGWNNEWNNDDNYNYNNKFYPITVNNSSEIPEL